MSPHRHNYLVTTINSTAVFVISYLFVYLVYQFSTAWMASDYDIQLILFHNTLKCITSDYSSLWTSDSAVVVFGIGPLISIILGVIFIFLFHELIDTKGFIKLFLLWAATHFFVRTFSSFTIGTIFFLYGSNLVADWLLIGWAGKMILSIISILVLIACGIYSTNAFVQSSDALYLIKQKTRGYFILFQVIIPWFTGSILILLLQLPGTALHEILLLISFLFIIIPVFSRFHLYVLYGQENEIPFEKLSVNWFSVILMLLIMAAYRILLNNGIAYL